MPDSSALPLYLRTAEALIRDIGAGRLADGARLPPEREMADQLGLSVGTLRKSLANLAAKGLLERRHGSGNYVRHRSDVDSVYAMFRLELIEGGGLPTAQVLSAGRHPGGPDFSNCAQAGFRIRRLRLLGGVAAAVEEIWLENARAGQLAASELTDSLYRFYTRRLGFTVVRAEDRVGVDVVPQWATDRLAASVGQPCGLVERTAWDSDDQIAEISRTWFDAGVARHVTRMK
jgi:GntR family transcriptional regulator